jgi:hypothetical protein
MTRTLRLAAIACLTLLLAGCAATGPKFAEVEANLPALRAGEGRIYIFRENTGMGAGVRPDVRLNGEVVGAPQPGSFFFVDKPVGHYTASARTEAESSVEFLLREGENAYVSLRIGMGLLVGRPQLMLHPAQAGAAALPGLAYIGSVPLAPGRADPVTAGAVPGGTGRSTTPAPVAAPPAARQGAVTLDDLSGLLPAAAKP